MDTQKTINVKGSLLTMDTPQVMGILNVTPDSFYAASRMEDTQQIVDQAGMMLDAGAILLDIGGYSSRPGAKDVSIQEECDRVLPAVEAIVKAMPKAFLSVDTFRSPVAKQAVMAGASLINDISAGLLDEAMLETVGQLSVPYIAMHMRGTPQTMQTLSTYDDLLKEIVYYFSERLVACRAAGIKDVVIDPGFGFSKTPFQNFELLGKMELLQSLGRPILVGLSRKSMIYKTLDTVPESTLNGTTVLNTVALLRGASILRVHDVKEAVEAVKLINSLNN